MRIQQLTIQKYRSIVEAYKLPLKDTTVLLGPNNQGKSNVLKALVSAMKTISLITSSEQQLSPPRFHELLKRADIYDRERDYPIELQESRPDGDTVFTLNFQLTEEETEQFQDEVGSRLNESLPIKIAISSTRVQVTVPKKGPGGKALSAKSTKIAKFVSQRLQCDYIPAIRTANSARQVVDELIYRELARVETSARFTEAMRKVEDLLSPVLSELSSHVRDTIQQFLPSIQQVTFALSPRSVYEAVRRSCDIFVDDGSKTLLKFKGDGVQSLVALGIMRHASQVGSQGKSIVIALEEPESHLHPEAVHQLRDVIDELSSRHQVVISSHCPLFANRVRPEANVIVKEKKAVPARSIADVREALGVRVSDNLTSAELVVVVEGMSDVRIVRALVSSRSAYVSEQLRSGRLVFEHAGGTGKLTYVLSRLRSEMCQHHVLLDDDEAGNNAFKDAKAKLLLAEKDVTMIRLLGRKWSELEDIIDDSLCSRVVAEYLGESAFRVVDNGRLVWSDRVKDGFNRVSKPWTNTTEKELKERIASAVETDPMGCLKSTRDLPIVNLIKAIEAKLITDLSARGAAEG
jgi:putative ATP-dependent endonuclease of OLD family